MGEGKELICEVTLVLLFTEKGEGKGIVTISIVAIKKTN